MERMVLHPSVRHEMLLHQRPAYGLGHSTLELALDRVRVDRLSDITGKKRILNGNLSGLDIHSNAHALAAEGIGMHLVSQSITLRSRHRRIP